jgi:hypothetical protein
MTKDLGVVIEWDESQLDHYLKDPNGELGRDLMTKLAEVVLAGAKARARVRTGRMRNEMRYRIGRDERGLFADIISPVRNPVTGFPYAIVHEGKKVRDRRAHRSLKPALRDIKKILVG